MAGLQLSRRRQRGARANTLAGADGGRLPSALPAGAAAPQPGEPALTPFDAEASVLEDLGIAAAIIDLQGGISLWNDAAAQLYGRPTGEMLGAPLGNIRFLDGESIAPGPIAAELPPEGGWRGEIEILDGAGGPLALEIRARVLHDGAGAPVGVAVLALDLRERTAAEQRAVQAERKLRLAECIPEWGSWAWDARSDHFLPSDRFTSLLGLDPSAKLTLADAISGMPPEDGRRARASIDRLLRKECESLSLEYRLRASDGSQHWLEAHCQAVRDRDGTITAILGITKNVTLQREAQQQVAIEASERRESQRALLLTRDYLRAVSDSMGEAMYTSDCEGRLTYMNRAAQDLLGWTPEELLGKAVHAIAHCRRSDGSELPVAECPILRARAKGEIVRVDDDVFVRRDGTSVPVAYTAAPFATDDGIQGCVVVFKDITERKAEERRVQGELAKLAWVGRVQQALAEDRFVLHAQPIVELRTGAVAQRELLLRIRSGGEEEELIAPGAFLPVAEEYGLVADIDRWVIDRAAEIAAGGQPVELNVSGPSISEPSLVEHIEAAIARTGADPESLTFEITETTLVSDEAAGRAFVEHMHRLGCRVALDDFGTGYGSFTYLKQLPIDYLKIDIEFVRDVRNNPASRNVVEAIVDLAKRFELKTVGEGVEDAATAELLRELGVDFAQGFHLGRPEPLAISPIWAI